MASPVASHDFVVGDTLVQPPTCVKRDVGFWGQGCVHLDEWKNGPLTAHALINPARAATLAALRKRPGRNRRHFDYLTSPVCPNIHSFARIAE